MSSWIKEFLINPCWTALKVILMGIGGLATLSTAIEGFRTWQSISDSTKLVNTMIFENVPEYVIYAAIAFGVIITVLLQYFIEYEEHMRKKNEIFKFEIKYVVAGLCTAITAAFVSYVVCFFGLDLTGKTIDNAGLAFVICVPISAVITWAIDAWLYHRIIDGTVLMLWNKGQAKLREEAEAVVREQAAALAEQELKDAIFRTVEAKCKAAGLLDEEKIARIAKLVKDPEEDSAVLDALITAYKG